VDGQRKRKDLAYFGGKPIFSQQVHVGTPNIGDHRRLHDRIGRVLESRRLTNDGPLLLEFEDWIAATTGTAHAVAVCNGTISLQLIARALGLRGEVILPSLTHAASAHALEWIGLTPVFCDIDPVTGNLDPDLVDWSVTERTAAILGVHLWGRICETGQLQQVADRHRLPLFYDSAHALGCTAEGKPAGGFGRAESFSFHATKFVNAFEGGVVTTNDGDLAGRLRALRCYGYNPEGQVAGPGINAKLTEACAAMGLTSAEIMPQIIATNAAHHRRYAAALDGVPGLTLRQPPSDQTSNYQYVVIEVGTTESGLGRDELMRILHAENIMAKRYFWPAVHQLEPYRSRQPVHTPRPLLHTERLSGRVLSLPTGTSVDSEQVDRVAEALVLAASGS
jgi:dTDP-4-amino-4,6-dideoxy-D-glucose transaminase